MSFIPCATKIVGAPNVFPLNCGEVFSLRRSFIGFIWFLVSAKFWVSASAKFCQLRRSFIGFIWFLVSAKFGVSASAKFFSLRRSLSVKNFAEVLVVLFGF